jgi:hypothetical protein
MTPRTGVASATAVRKHASIENLRRIEFGRRLRDFCLPEGAEHTGDSGPFDKERTDCGIQRNVTKIKNA